MVFPFLAKCRYAQDRAGRKLGPLHGRNLSGTVTLLAVLRSTVDLDELSRAADAIMQRCGDRETVGRNAICRNLERRAGCRVAKPFDENIRSQLVALADGDV